MKVLEPRVINDRSSASSLRPLEALPLRYIPNPKDSYICNRSLQSSSAHHGPARVLWPGVPARFLVRHQKHWIVNIENGRIYCRKSASSSHRSLTDIVGTADGRVSQIYKIVLAICFNTDPDKGLRKSLERRRSGEYVPVNALPLDDIGTKSKSADVIKADDGHNRCIPDQIAPILLRRQNRHVF